MKENKKLLITVASLLVAVLSVTLAYFTARIIGEGKSISVRNANLQIIFTDGTDGSITGTNITPGWSTSKTFSVTNKSNETYKYNIIIQNLVNTFITEDYLKYKITSTDGGYNMSEYKSVPKSSEETDMLLSEEVSIEVGKTHNYTVEFVYNNDENFDQSVDMNKTLTGTIFIDKSTTLYDKLLFDNPTIKTRTDFSVTFTETNVNTLYKASEQIGTSESKDVYYFAGDAQNNWVKFGGYSVGACGVGEERLVYISDPTDIQNSIRQRVTKEQCLSGRVCKVQMLQNNVVAEEMPAIVDNEESCTTLANTLKQQIPDSEGADAIGTYTYLNTEYHEQDSKEFYWRIIRTNHDGSIRLLYHGDSPESTEVHIGESFFVSNTNTTEKYVFGFKNGQDNTSLDGSRENTVDSDIKLYLDDWYSYELSSYTKYLSNDAVYCNDREPITEGGYVFKFNKRKNTSPTYNCTNISDAFSVNNTEAKLTYPVGLITGDELEYIGKNDIESTNKSYSWFYKNSLGNNVITKSMWTITPDFFQSDAKLMYVVNSDGITGEDMASSNASFLVRPVTSLKSCVKLSGGDGSATNPYTILETETGC
mgnify:FL=1